MPYVIESGVPETFHLVADDLDATLTAAQLIQAVRETDRTFRGYVEGVGAPDPHVPWRFSFNAPADRAEVADAIDWLAMRGQLTFVNSDPNTVDLMPEGK